jgi:antitoxin (DNA-binding transcriptional repressor) of toxin-antitoxin stability system
MKEFTYSEARQHLATLLERARRDGAVRIRRRDGQIFVLRPAERSGSPLDVPGVDLDVDVQEIVNAVHEGRRPVPAPASTTQRRRPASPRRP